MLLYAMGDLHLDARTAGFRRFDDVHKAARQVVREAIDAQADAFCFLGDLCNPESACAFEAVEVAVDFALQLSGNGIVSYWLTGNHDVVEDGGGSSVLTPLHALVDEVIVCDRPGLFSEQVAMDRVAILALPFTPTARTYDSEHLVHTFDGQFADKHVVVLSHLTIPEAQPGSETTDMPRGRDVLLPAQVLRELTMKSRARSVTVLQGHYHKGQELLLDGLSVHVAGSLERLRFDEETNEPRYLVVEIG